jgi:hypothetical protein
MQVVHWGKIIIRQLYNIVYRNEQYLLGIVDGNGQVEIYAQLRPCYTVQFFLQLAMQFYSWEMLISEISEEFSICWENISGVQAECNEDSYLAILHLSRIALQVARKIAPCNMAFRPDQEQQQGS